MMSVVTLPKWGCLGDPQHTEGWVSDHMVTQLILTEWHSDSRSNQGQDKYFTYKVEKLELRDISMACPDSLEPVFFCLQAR